MRLKRLVLHGFKSFADRTTLTFEGRGVTSIVGPNGCGKSNVIDAVKWVLGEQRPTSLRGKEMMDVIFNGTVRRPAMGLCEGSLVFDNASGTLPLDEDEVSVTRRVFRSGETEYLLNGRPVRLKDIRDLFAGTGLGYGGYAFMEQGKIDSVLASNAVERRRVFEEAAGISRFRARRRETELKLKRVEDNLTRLTDITEEISRQIRSLKIHAGKARSHREMTARIREQQLRLNTHRYREISAEQEQLAASFSSLERERDGHVERQQALREEVRRIEADLEERMEAVGESRTRQAERQGRIETFREKVTLHSGYQKEIGERLANREAESRLLDEKLEKLKQDRVLNAREREDAAQDATRTRELLARKEEAVARQEDEAGELQRGVGEAEERLREVEALVAEAAREQVRLETDAAHLEQRQRSLDERRAALESGREELRASVREKSGLQVDQSSTLEDGRRRLADEEARADGLERRFVEEGDGHDRLQSELTRARARREVVAGMLEKLEGAGEGARSLIERHREDPSFLPGFHGLLADVFDVDLDRAPAVDRALGELASALVVETVDDVLAGFRHLEESGSKGALFLPLDRFRDVPERGLAGVRPTAPEFRPLLAALLGDLELVPAEDLADRVRGGSAGPLLVTTAGSVVRDGRVFAAPRPRGEAAGLVVLQAELRDLDRRLPGLQEQEEAARRRMDEVHAERDAARARVKELSVELLRQEGEAARLDQEVVRMVREVERHDADLGRLREEIQAARQRSEEVARAREELDREQEERAARRRTAEEEVERQRARARDQARLLQDAVRDLSALRVDGTRLEGRLASLGARGEELEGALAETEQRRVASREEIEELHQSLERVAALLEDEQQRLQELFQEAEQGQELVAAREREAADVRGRLKERVTALEEVEELVAELNERIGSSRGREGELKAAMESLLERTREELGVELQEAAADAAPADGDEDVDWRAVDREIRELRDRVARLGNVNLAAVEELEEAEERASFLFRERDDLEKSREQLRRVLRDIAERSTAMFLETFGKVGTHFSEIFRKLFGGGKAEILLEDADNPLESGIEIRARPPGKELRSITLLSGGERTLTAVALLFAIFRANPAPCAFLDEVDAALDEDNTERFCRMLEEFLDLSQFIIVTHSRRTMERSDLLIGVTMPERGVSRPITVLLEQVAEDGHIEVKGPAPEAEGAPAGEPAVEGMTARRLEVATTARRARSRAGEAGDRA